ALDPRRKAAVLPLDSLTGFEGLNLELVSVNETAVSDLSPLASMSKLTELRIMETKVTDLRPLAKLRALQNLDARDTGVRDLAPLSSLPLVELSVAYSPVSSLEPLRNMRTLEDLDVGSTNVRSLEPIADLPRLQRLSSDGSLVPKAELDALREARPSMHIHHVYSSSHPLEFD
ncbi:MAG: hypothetical protein KUG77_27810, partial [Nannocystaceae bacterium]|nr:hypothetical protein [Nannocystaceae bacterium]